MVTLTRQYVALFIIIFLLLFCAIDFHNKNIDLRKENEELSDKVDFYEKVITDFGMDEFINYPEIYYQDGYVDQVKVHNCMWAFDLDM